MISKISTKKIFLSSLTLAAISISTPSFSMLLKIKKLAPTVKAFCNLKTCAPLCKKEPFSFLPGTQKFNYSKYFSTASKETRFYSKKDSDHKEKCQSLIASPINKGEIVASEYFAKKELALITAIKEKQEKIKPDTSKIFTAIKKNSLEEINLIPDDTDFENEFFFEGYTPATLAAIYCDSSTIKYLMQKTFFKKSINKKDKRGKTPLDWLSKTIEIPESLRVIKLLIENGASTNMDGNFKKVGCYLALYKACVARDKDYVKFLFEKTNIKDRINDPEYSCINVLDYTLKDKNLDLAEFLIKNGAKPSLIANSKAIIK